MALTHGSDGNETGNTRLELTQALVAGSDFMRPPDEHANGKSCWLNATIVPHFDGRAALVMTPLPMVRPTKDLPGSVLALTPSSYAR